MFFTYLWKPVRCSQKDAFERFSSILSNQCRLYKDAFGEEPILRIKQLRNVLIGQIHYDVGIIGWDPWIDKGEAGIVWGGVCEDYLGKTLDAEQISQIATTIEQRPQELCVWDGMFSLITWCEDRVIQTTAATVTPTLWYTEGPYGWASGSRAAPLLEVVGRTATPNRDSMHLYLLYGYFVSGHSPFEHVFRLQDRQQVIIEHDKEPVIREYASLEGYLASEHNITDRNEILSFAADRIIGRVTNQLKHSNDPVVLLTGGKDSRSIAAAARKSGLHFVTSTSGPNDSQEVSIASQVAKILKVEHRRDGEGVSADLLCRAVERMQLWTLISEGLLPLNYCLHMKEFLSSSIPAKRNPIFHGLHPGLGHGYHYNYEDFEYPGKVKSMSLEDAHALIEIRNPYLKPNPPAAELLDGVFRNLDNFILQDRGTADQWLDLYYWRQRGSLWGMDLQSVYSPLRWAWMPLFDRELIRLSWNLTFEQKIACCFLKEVSDLIEPALANIPCTRYTLADVTLTKRVWRRIDAEVKYYLSKVGLTTRLLRQQNRVKRQYQDLWNLMLFSEREHIWKEFIDEKHLLEIIRLNPQSQLLWHLSTLELLSEIFFQRSEVIANV